MQNYNMTLNHDSNHVVFAHGTPSLFNIDAIKAIKIFKLDQVISKIDWISQNITSGKR